MDIYKFSNFIYTFLQYIYKSSKELRNSTYFILQNHSHTLSFSNIQISARRDYDVKVEAKKSWNSKPVLNPKLVQTF